MQLDNAHDLPTQREELLELLRCRSVVSSCEDAIITIDLHGVITGWNPGAEKLLGYTKEEALGRDFSFVAPPNKQEEMLLIRNSAPSGKSLGTFETERRHKDGHLIPVSVTSSVITDLDGEGIGTAGILRDITARKARQESMRRFASILDATREAIVGLEVDGQIYGWNKGAEKLYGYTAEEVVGQSFAVLIPPAWRPEFDTLLVAVAGGNPQEDLQVFHRRQDGTKIEVSTSLSPILDEAGKTVAIVSVSIDLTPARKADQRWRLVLQNAPDSILTVGRDHRIEFINRTDIGKPSSQQVVGMRHDVFVPLEHRVRARAMIDDVFETGQAVHYETQAGPPDGPVGYYDCRLGPLIQDGVVESVVVIASDITQRRQMEEELRHSQAQLQRLSAHQQTAVEEERRRIARELHDELGQLLTALKIDLAWLEQRVAPDLQGRTHAMGEVLDSTMSTVRRISSRLRPNMLDLLGLGPALDWLVQDTCSRSGLDWSLNVSPGNFQLSDDCSLAVYRICQESLTNVVRHARARRVEVELDVQGPRIRLRVADDGVGISNDQMHCSLGLLGIRERVRMLQGTVTIRGEAGQGTEIMAYFPAPQGLP